MRRGEIPREGTSVPTPCWNTAPASTFSPPSPEKFSILHLRSVMRATVASSHNAILSWRTQVESTVELAMVDKTADYKHKDAALGFLKWVEKKAKQMRGSAEHKIFYALGLLGVCRDDAREMLMIQKILLRHQIPAEFILELGKYIIGYYAKVMRPVWDIGRLIRYAILEKAQYMRIREAGVWFDQTEEEQETAEITDGLAGRLAARMGLQDEVMDWNRYRRMLLMPEGIHANPAKAKALRLA